MTEVGFELSSEASAASQAVLEYLANACWNMRVKLREAGWGFQQPWGRKENHGIVSPGPFLCSLQPFVKPLVQSAPPKRPHLAPDSVFC